MSGEKHVYTPFGWVTINDEKEREFKRALADLEYIARYEPERIERQREKVIALFRIAARGGAA